MINARAVSAPRRAWFRIRVCAIVAASLSVPAGFPEPYLYDRLASGSDVAVGVEAASARIGLEQPNHFSCSIDTIIANIVYKVNSCTKQLHEFCLVAASLRFRALQSPKIIKAGDIGDIACVAML